METKSLFVSVFFGLMATLSACEKTETTAPSANPPSETSRSADESQMLAQEKQSTVPSDSERAIENDGRVEDPPANEPNRRSTLLFSSSLVGGRIKDAKGNDVGKIKDLLLDPENRRVVYAILSLSNREIAVPLSAVKMDPQTQTYTLEMTAENLAEAPKIGKDKKLPAELGESTRQEELASSAVIREPGKSGP
jgi:sporulation protein YlmC with PRC-barrel domain